MLKDFYKMNMENHLDIISDEIKYNIMNYDVCGTTELFKNIVSLDFL